MSTIDETIGVRTLRDINTNAVFWEQFEYDNWKLICFTGRKEARFGWLVGCQYTKYCTVREAQVEFLLGVAPDVLDQFTQYYKEQ